MCLVFCARPILSFNTVPLKDLKTGEQTELKNKKYISLLEKEKYNNHSSKDLLFRKDAVLGTTADPVE